MHRLKMSFFFLVSLKTKRINPFPQAGCDAPVLSSGGNFVVKPAQSLTPVPTCTNSVGGAGSFYTQANKCPVVQLPSSSSNFSAVPAKKPAISVRGKCLPHTEGRFRVEVGYHAELIAVFKSIPSKNYGKCLYCWYLLALQSHYLTQICVLNILFLCE